MSNLTARTQQYLSLHLLTAAIILGFNTYNKTIKMVKCNLSAFRIPPLYSIEHFFFLSFTIKGFKDK